MTPRPQFARRVSRPGAALAAVLRAYPDAAKAGDDFRAGRGRDGLPDWPDWCYLPLAAAYAIVSGGGPRRVSIERAHHLPIVGALLAWRMTQGVYRIDPALYDALVATPVDGEIPVEVLYRLPEWCVYVETPGLAWGARPVHGAWAHLESDVSGGPDELRLLLDTADDPTRPLDAVAGCVALPLILGDGGITGALDRLEASAMRGAAAHGLPFEGLPSGSLGTLRRAIEPVVSLVLYLCSEAAELGRDTRRPGNPAPKRLRDGWRLFAADGLRTWDVGVRFGAALRAAYHAAEVGEPAGPGSSPRPHIRRAHWHTYRVGPERAGSVLRWLPPIAVMVDSVDDLPTTIRPVKP